VSVPSTWVGRNDAGRWNRHSSETSAYKIHTPGKFPEDYILHSQHGESLKTTIIRKCLMEQHVSALLIRHHHTKHVLSGHDLLITLQHAAPLITYTISCVGCFYIIINSQHSGVFNLAKTCVIRSSEGTTISIRASYKVTNAHVQTKIKSTR
jgi:hypothetical protein